MNNLSYYGGFRTRKFTDIYGKVEDFITDYNNNGISPTISQESLTTLYYLLYARYGNSHIANSDENQFKYKVFSTIFMYGPAWEKRLDVQKKVRGFTEDDLITGSKQIVNHAFNPSTEPSTSTLQELTTINDQNTSSYKKSKLDAYGLLWNLLATDVTEEFINKFRKLFIQITSPDYPLLYETITDDSTII